MGRITFFDVEYANLANRSLCQVAVRCVDRQTQAPLLPDLCLLVNPEDAFDELCVSIHGITAADVAGAQTFPEIWPLLEPYLTNSVVIGHNVHSADLRPLVEMLNRYDLPVPSFYYFDTLTVSRRLIPRGHTPNYKLTTLIASLHLPAYHAHDAGEDVRACEALFYTLCQVYGASFECYVRRFCPDGGRTSSHPIM